MTLTTRYSVFLSTGQFWTQCLNKLQFIPRLLSEIRHRWPLIRQTYLEHPLVWARSPHPQNSKRFSVTRPGWNVGLPSLLWHSPQLWQQICQLFEPAALYPFTDWSPELLSTDKTVASFENFQGSHRKSNPVPPILWRSASTNCAIARYPKNTGVRIYQQSARREFSYRCMSSRMLRSLELKIFSDVSKYTAWKCGQYAPPTSRYLFEGGHEVIFRNTRTLHSPTPLREPQTSQEIQVHAQLENCWLSSQSKCRPRTIHESPEGEHRYSSALSLTSVLDRGDG